MIVFASRTGNVRHIVSKVQAASIELSEEIIVKEPYLLITYTDGLGAVPSLVEKFLERNASYCRGVVVSGNSNFGPALFGGAGDKISAMYQIPLVRKIDLRGYQADYEEIQKYYETRVTR